MLNYIYVSLPLRSSAGSDVDHTDGYYTRQFALEHQVHDVDEHFRRSLASMQSKPPTSTPYTGSSTESRAKRSRPSGEIDSHQIVITENAASSQPQLQQVTTPRVTTCATPTLIPTVTSQGIQYILSPAGTAGTVTPARNILTRVSSNGTSPVRAAIQAPQVLYNIPAAAAAAAAQKVVNGGAAIAMATSGADVVREANAKKATGEWSDYFLDVL